MRNFGSTKFWCHLSIQKGETYTNSDIRKSKPLKVKTYSDLVKTVAKISNHNPDFNLFFRGQKKDYVLNSGSSSFYPSIFRSPGRSLTVSELETRYKVLELCREELLIRLESMDIENIHKLKKFRELPWSILQHYEVCGTPLLDFTHSLRVAASFALNNSSDTGYVYLFAFPYPNGTISYFTEEEMLNVRLLSTCPSEALRPHFQEGYLIAPFPSELKRKQPFLDFGRRLIAKIEISKKSFWSKDFPEIPESALSPSKDQMATICSDIKLKYGT